MTLDFWFIVLVKRVFKCLKLLRDFVCLFISCMSSICSTISGARHHTESSSESRSESSRDDLVATLEGRVTSDDSRLN